MRSLLVEAFRIPSGSMENTLLIGDFLFVNKMLYGAEIPLTNKHLPPIREPARPFGKFQPLRKRAELHPSPPCSAGVEIAH